MHTFLAIVGLLAVIGVGIPATVYTYREAIEWLDTRSYALAVTPAAEPLPWLDWDEDARIRQLLDTIGAELIDASSPQPWLYQLADATDACSTDISLTGFDRRTANMLNVLLENTRPREIARVA